MYFVKIENLLKKFWITLFLFHFSDVLHITYVYITYTYILHIHIIYRNYFRMKIKKEFSRIVPTS